MTFQISGAYEMYTEATKAPIEATKAPLYRPFVAFVCLSIVFENRDFRSPRRLFPRASVTLQKGRPDPPRVTP
jgi:hypothetical protein